MTIKTSGIRPIRRVYADIEVSPNIGLFWAPGSKVSISHDSIVRERAVMCICWKLEGSREVKKVWWDDKQDDKKLLMEFFSDPDIQDADEIVAHYGLGFDFPWLRTRILFHGLSPMPLFKFVDTKAWAAKHFYFNSNKLDYIAKFLFGEGKIKTEYNWWIDILLKNCRSTLNKMVIYCAKDVTLLERVWKKLLPHVPSETHAGVVAGLPQWTCPRTGSTKVKLSKRRVTASGQVKYQMQNLEDGSFYSISQRAFDSYEKHKLPKVRNTPKKGNGGRRIN